MASLNSIYRLAITHAAQRAVEDRERLMVEWRARPLWRRLWGGPRQVPILMEYEPLHRSYATLADARVAAQRAADELADPTGSDVGVAILDGAGEEVGGYWSGGGGSF